MTGVLLAVAASAYGEIMLSAKPPYRVVVLPGDGVGPEVTAAARRLMDATGVRIDWDVRATSCETSSRLPGLVDGAADAIRRCGVALKGPIATPLDGSVASPNVGLRRTLGLAVQIRRARSLPGTSRIGRDVDVAIVRETTEGLYQRVGLHAGTPASARLHELLTAAGHEVPPGAAYSIKYASEAAARRVWTDACAFARRAGRGAVTAVGKSAVMPHTDGMFASVGREIAAEAGLEFENVPVDTVAAQLVQRPERFSVLVTTNLYGDVLSDLAGALAGSVGLVSGSNIGLGATVFEPSHGCAFRHAGRDTVNPVGAILSGASALELLGEVEAADAVRDAVSRTVASGVVTPDLAGPGQPSVGTTAFTVEVEHRLAPAVDRRPAAVRR